MRAMGPRPRPFFSKKMNEDVAFELGYFAGNFGRRKVCLLRKGEVEISSDLYAAVYTELDANDHCNSP